jgi:hypothetical protein
MPVGVGSNLIVRDGGVPGVVVRLPKSFAKVAVSRATTSGPARPQWASPWPARRATPGLRAWSFCAAFPARPAAPFA